jgi:DnaK suppressor protein
VTAAAIARPAAVWGKSKSAAKGEADHERQGPCEIQKLLLAKRDELAAARDQSAALVPSSDGSGGDLVDVASADLEAEIQIRTHKPDVHLVRAIEGALARIRWGTFGTCETCKRPLSKARLEAVPWTRLCRECKEREQSAALRIN